MNITATSLALFLDLAKDANNWSGNPYIGGNVSGSKELRGNITQLKRAKLIETVADKDAGMPYVVFAEAGLALALENGIYIYGYNHERDDEHTAVYNLARALQNLSKVADDSVAVSLLVAVGKVAEAREADRISKLRANAQKAAEYFARQRELRAAAVVALAEALRGLPSAVAAPAPAPKYAECADCGELIIDCVCAERWAKAEVERLAAERESSSDRPLTTGCEVCGRFATSWSTAKQMRLCEKHADELWLDRERELAEDTVADDSAEYQDQLLAEARSEEIPF